MSRTLLGKGINLNIAILSNESINQSIQLQLNLVIHTKDNAAAITSDNVCLCLMFSICHLGFRNVFKISCQLSVNLVTFRVVRFFRIKLNLSAVYMKIFMKSLLEHVQLTIIIIPEKPILYHCLFKSNLKSLLHIKSFYIIFDIIKNTQDIIQILCQLK